MTPIGRATSTDLPDDFPAPGEAARKRAALELIKRHEQALRRTARRYSLCADDAEDAYQRALLILLTKAPTDDPRQLIRWMQTVTKHEALAVRRNRERLLGPPGLARDEEGADWVQLIPSERAGPADLAERRERAARSREALQSLKPQELRALSLLAEGYSYREISGITGWTRTKVNRCLAEGRARFREVISSSESGGRCDQLSAALSAFCDGEASARDAGLLREHLRACAHCRATLREFRAAPPAAAALAPGLAALTLLDRLQAALAGLGYRIAGRSGPAEDAISQVTASGGARGAGLALSLKLLATCLGTVGGAAVGLATGVLPAGNVAGDETPAAGIERSATAAKRNSFVARVGAAQPAVPASFAQAGAGRRDEAEANAEPGPPSAAPPPVPTPEAPPPPPAPASAGLQADRVTWGSARRGVLRAERRGSERAGSSGAGRVPAAALGDRAGRHRRRPGDLAEPLRAECGRRRGERVTLRS